MKFGVGLITGQIHPDDNRSTTEIYDDVVEISKLVEEVGLNSVWVSEHHFAEDGYMSGIMPTLGSLASVTEDIQLGTFVVLAPLHDAVRLSEDAATVDLLSNGRLILGVAIGYHDLEFKGFGVPKEERVNRLIDSINVLRGAWGEGSLGYDPAYHDISPNITVTPKPEDKIPIVLGGLAKPAVERAARLGDGWAAGEVLTLEDLEKRRSHIKHIRDSKDCEDDFEFIVAQHGFIGDSKEDAWERMRDSYLYVERKYAEWSEGKSVDQLSPERIKELKNKAVIGTPDEVAHEIKRYKRVFEGDLHFIFRCWYPGMDSEEIVKCIKRYSDEVVPQLK